MKFKKHINLAQVTQISDRLMTGKSDSSGELSVITQTGSQENEAFEI